MERDLRVYLEDVVSAVKIIEQYTKGISYKTFSKSLMIQDAAIRRLIVIGEAFSRYKHLVPKDNPNFPHIQAISMKNFLVHEYEKVELSIVWNTIKEDLPDLKKKIEKLLK